MRNHLEMHEDFMAHLMEMPLKADTTANPWLLQMWEQFFSCSWNLPSDSKSNCEHFQNASRTGLLKSIYAGQYSDAVWVFARAMDALIRQDCPEAFDDKTLLYDCISGARLLWFIRKVNFPGVSGQVILNEKGDKLGKTTVHQYVYRNTNARFRHIGTYNGEIDELEILMDRIDWLVYNDMRDREIDDLSNATEKLKSVCSQPCKKREYLVLQEERCCWQCRHCRVNEHINENKTGCEICPTLSWPDETSAMFCIQIPPSFTQPHSPLGLTILIVSSLGLVLATATCIWYIKERHHKLIKASSRGLCGFILVGIILTFGTAFLFIVEPSDLVCRMRLGGFLMSVAFIYAPLSVKSNRIYRIFSAGKKSTTKPPLIGNRMQLLFTTILLLIQV